jgi:pyruvate formate lyase activating enzyme
MNTPSDVTGFVTDIQHFSVHDGPGIRTTVFLKGCNMRCSWCHNPETQATKPELQWYPDRCIGCGACLKACSRGAQGIADGRRFIDRALCVACGECAAVCFAESLSLSGRSMDCESVMRDIVDDRPFYDHSGGGVTLSGGEPLLQIEFAVALLEACRSAGIHTAIETNLAWPWTRVARALALTDLVMMDVKDIDASRHQLHTGIPQDEVWSNLARIAERRQPVIVRTPVIPGVNDRPDTIAAIARRLVGVVSLLYYELIPFHGLGAGKYESLGRGYSYAGRPGLTRAELEPLAEAAQGEGIEVRIQGKALT